MPRLKEAEELNIKELEEAEYEEGSGFAKYEGEIPDTGTMLLFRVTKMWWTYSAGNDEMLKVLCVAEDNPGDLEEFDGLPCWENMVLTAGAKFKWDPFLDHFDLSIRDVSKKLYVEDEDDNQGAPIQKIGAFVPGSDDAVFVGVVSKERYKGKWQAHISEWLDADTPLEEEEKPARRSRSNGGRKASSATGRGRKQRDEEPEDEPDDEPDEEERPARSRSRRQPAKSTARKPASRSRRNSKDDEDDDPPF